MAIVTAWSLQAPNGQDYQAVISAHGVVSFDPVGAPITLTPPVYQDEGNPAVVHTPSISNTGVITLTQGADTGQLRAALIDVNGAQYIAVVSNGIAFFRAPQLRIGDLVSFGLFAQESVPLLVKSIAPGPDFTARITFVDAAPGVHLAAEGLIPPFDSHLTLPRIGQEPMPRPRIDRVVSDETVMLRSTDGSLVPRILVSLQLPSGGGVPAVQVEAQHRLSGSTGPWERQLFAADSTIELSLTTVLEGLTYDLRVRTIGAVGQTSEWVTIEAHSVVGKTSPPPDVTGLSLNGEQLVWVYPAPPPDLAGFRVRVQVGERTSWGDALPLHDGLVSHTGFVLFRDSGMRTYLVKAEDTSGNESLNAATVFVDYGALATRNIAEVIDLKALGFPGTISNGSLLAEHLVASSDTLFWKSDGLPFWTTDGAIMWPGTYKDMQYVATIVPPLSWLGGVLLLDAVVAANGWRFDYAQDSGAPFWGDPATLFWSGDGLPFWSGLPSAFAPWPGQLIGYTRQAYQIRLTTFGGNIQGVVSQLAVIFDMPDLEELVLNVALSDQGTRIPLTKSFAAILVVVPQVVDDDSGAVRIRVVDKEATGPLVMAVNAADTSVNGHGDVIVRGY